MRLGIQSKLVLTYTLIALLAAGGIGILSHNRAGTALTETIIDQLDSIRSIKANQVEDYFRQRLTNVLVYSINPEVRTAFEELATAFATTGSTSNARWERTAERYDAMFRNYMKSYGYYDFLFVDNDGNVIYSVSKEADLGQNVHQDLAGTVLAKAAEAGSESPSLIDFELYDISGKPAAFVTGPVKGLTDASLSGTIIFQIELTHLNEVMHARTGLGETGSTYLVGPDYLMRNDSFFDPEHHSVEASFIDPENGAVHTEAVDQALTGTTGHGITTNYFGKEVISSWQKLNIPGLPWVLIAEQGTTEALYPVHALSIFIQLVAMGVLIVAFLGGAIFSRNIAGQVTSALSLSKAIADGDLTQKINRESNDEIGDMVEAMGVMQERLRTIVDTIKDRVSTLREVGNDLTSNTTETSAATEQIRANAVGIEQQAHQQKETLTQSASAIEEINRTIESLDQAIERQASAVTQSSASIEEMIASIKSISQNVESVSGDVKDLRTASEEGVGAIESMSKNAVEIASQSATLKELNHIISEIASRTNLLAMNAAIEAAHAGDAGRGFAVVAEEIRSLAETSAAQSQSVATQLKLIQGAIKNVVNDTQVAEKTFSSFFSHVEHVQEITEQINSAVSEQSAGGTQVLQALNEITAVTSEVQSGSHEMKAGGIQILSATRQVEQLSISVTGGIDEIANGINEINKSMTNVQELTAHNGEHIAEIVQTVDIFRTTDETEEPV